MMMKKIWVCAIAIIFSAGFIMTTFAASKEPVRIKGLSVHVVPEVVAKLDNTGKVQAGFATSYVKAGEYVYERNCPTPKDLLAYFRSFPSDFQENGIWVVVTNPGAYSAEEMKTREELIELCQKEKIPLFICRGAELPDGWRRY
jgi:hypothetical protein